MPAPSIITAGRKLGAEIVRVGDDVGSGACCFPGIPFELSGNSRRLTFACLLTPGFRRDT
jgi:hypothetical protein